MNYIEAIKQAEFCLSYVREELEEILDEYLTDFAVVELSDTLFGIVSNFDNPTVEIIELEEGEEGWIVHHATALYTDDVTDLTRLTKVLAKFEVCGDSYRKYIGMNAKNQSVGYLAACTEDAQSDLETELKIIKGLHHVGRSGGYLCLPEVMEGDLDLSGMITQLGGEYANLLQGLCTDLETFVRHVESFKAISTALTVNYVAVENTDTINTEQGLFIVAAPPASLTEDRQALIETIISDLKSEASQAELELSLHEELLDAYDFGDLAAEFADELIDMAETLDPGDDFREGLNLYSKIEVEN